jgi:hypothetical protein
MAEAAVLSRFKIGFDLDGLGRDIFQVPFTLRDLVAAIQDILQLICIFEILKKL